MWTRNQIFNSSSARDRWYCRGCFVGKGGFTYKAELSSCGWLFSRKKTDLGEVLGVWPPGQTPSMPWCKELEVEESLTRSQMEELIGPEVVEEMTRVRECPGCHRELPLYVEFKGEVCGACAEEAYAQKKLQEGLVLAYSFLFGYNWIKKEKLGWHGYVLVRER